MLESSTIENKVNTVVSVLLLEIFHQLWISQHLPVVSPSRLSEDQCRLRVSACLP